MAYMKFFKQAFFLGAILLFLSACSLDDKTSYLRAVNASSNENYEDVITDIYICEDATNDNYVSVWNGKLRPNESKKIEIDSGNYGIKFTGTRYYNSGIEKPIEETTGYKASVRFANYWTVRVTYDGNGIVAEEED